MRIKQIACMYESKKKIWKKNEPKTMNINILNAFIA